MNEELLSQWRDEILQSTLPLADKRKYEKYILGILVNDVPVVLDLLHLAKLTGIDHFALRAMVASSENYYRKFNIPKHSGGFREIKSPYPSLLYVQQWIKENILSVVEIHKAAHGFVRKKSIITNAKIHLGAKSILKMDIKDFFPSISLNRVISIFLNFGYDKKLSYNLASLCCNNGSLPQGAATSPIISNIISRRMDVRLYKLAETWGLKYTRYADDMTFSGEHISTKLVELVEEVIQSEKFEVNTNKTRMFRGRGKKVITGISISSGKLTIPRKMKRSIRQDVYYLDKYSVCDNTELHLSMDPIYIERVVGKLNYWRSVEPDNKFVHIALEKLVSVQSKLNKLT